MDGVISFIKPTGITSHDAVAICRRLFKEKRIGHSGTLDPMAYGVLPIFLGKATRLIEYTDDFTKTYVAECRLGSFTDTEDASGNPVVLPEEAGIMKTSSLMVDKGYTSPEQIQKEDIEAILRQFQGQQEQVPSIYSAIKINGKRAYEYAREGIAVEIPARTITVHSIELLAYAYPFFTIRVSCSGGTYIRSLLRDICIALGQAGTMTQLCRTQVGPFSLDSSYMAEEIMLDGASLLQACDRAISHIPSLTISAEQKAALSQGKQLSIHPDFRDTQVGQIYRAYSPEGFMGIVKRSEKSIQVEKNIFL